ncbi:MAG: phosphodiester glycosidase family protein [Peptococcaceae bacterium]|nr:phosphodiester glycosidase family protein [Peptococcaceae bacterium]
MKRKILRGCGFFMGYVLLFVLLCPLMWLYGPFPYYRVLVTDMIANSSRSYIAYTLMGSSRIEEVTSLTSLQQMTVEPVITDRESSFVDEANGITIESIEGRKFKGKVMIVEDPSQIRVAMTEDMGTAGQRLADMIAGQKAVAGVNGGGFFDPNTQGSGALPKGTTIIDGCVVSDVGEEDYMGVVGFTRGGVLTLKKVTASEALGLGYVQAVTFGPFLLVDGVPQIVDDGGRGVAPRTGIGQRADGAVIFVVIDGRNAGWSMGANLRDLMNVFVEYQAVNAANLDGGSSTEMVYKGQTINRLWNLLGSRYLATSFVVMPR